jgi:hypothetical protein
MRSMQVAGRSLAGAFLLLAPACAGTQAGSAPEAVPLSAIVLSVDALAEQRMRESLEPSSIPNLLAIFDEAACATGAIAAFPTSTAPGHAALWTGAYGNVNGISANWQPRLPRDRHTLLEGVSGYFADGLRAEPIWITASRAGLRVGAHHVTQAPHAPHYPLVMSGDEDVFAARRAEADSLLRRPGVLVMNGYNQMLAPDAVITEEVAHPRAPSAWQGFDRLRSDVPPLEISWAIAGDSLHALLHGGNSYDRALISASRDVARSVAVHAAPVDTSSVVGRELARHFSAPLHLNFQGSPVSLSFRLFTLAADGSEFRLFHTAAHRVDASDTELGTRYVREVGGWLGNASLGLLRRGDFGTPLSRGGDGSAEAHYLETAELHTRQFMQGAEWILANLQPHLFADYFPLGDEIDHEFLGMVEPRFPGYDARVAARAQRVRERGWQLVDLRVGHLRRISASRPGRAFFVSGDHGMRPAWRVFRPNVALHEAGLLSRNATGSIDLSRTSALAPNGYWISVNTVDWKEGIVPLAERREVVARAERALLAVRDEGGEEVVTRTWWSVDHPELGLGGPVGGDLYFEVREGYGVSRDASGPLAASSRPEGKHGYPSTAADMHTALCMVAPANGYRRTGVVRTIDLAPTVAEWLGMPAPPDSRGRSLLRELLTRSP